MSLHKLTAGSGYDYLTRQVAALDATDKGHVGLASYYTEKGETPGVWVGSGMAGIDGLNAGDLVTAEHMQNLFGAGHHPLATDRTHTLDLQIGRADTASPTDADYRAAARLGAPFKVYDHDASAFRIEVAKRLADVNADASLPRDWAVPAKDRARIRTEVAREFFRAENGRDPSPGSDGARELAAIIAKHSQPKTTAVAGYDLTFSPVKSVSTLWAIADPATAAAIERAHQAAVQDALTFIETTALYSREGANGVRQVDVRGLVATAFTHRDSRAGDPDLHTHVAVANKVETLSPASPNGIGIEAGSSAGKWLAIDGRPLHKAIVSASETYNTALEHHLTDALGVRFEARRDSTNGTGRRKRPVREIVGVDPQLNARFSKRRASVEARRSVLAADFQATHGRPPTPVETLQLAQQATLETREAKHEPRTLAEQRETWRSEAVEVLGTPAQVARMLRAALRPTTVGRSRSGTDSLQVADAAWFAATADRILATLESTRSTWQYWHAYAEAQRQVRAISVPTAEVGRLVDLLVSEVLGTGSVSLARPTTSPDADADGITEPAQLRRADGSSVYTSVGADLYTSQRILAAEQRLVDAAAQLDGFAVDATTVGLALLESTANGTALNPGQASLVREMATSGARLQLAIAPAGSGKTTAMRALAHAWTDAGGTVVGLAPSAAAADALRAAIADVRTPDNDVTSSPASVRTETLALLTHALQPSDTRSSGPAVEPHPHAPRPTTATSTTTLDWVADIGPTTLVVIDEAGMADTLSLDAAVSYVLDRGGSVRLIGDDQQLTAIGAGGVLRDIRTQHGALQLSELVRFADSAEGNASLALRDGRTEALGFYLDHGRVHVGDLTTMSDEVFAAWLTDRQHGRDSIMLAPTRELVSELNQRARADRLHQLGSGQVPPNGRAVCLGDGNDASVGDLIITRENNRRLRATAADWVKNGDRWTVLRVHDDGDLTVQHLRHRHSVRLPHDYVQTATGLGYACTIHTAQGVTADTMHGLATGQETRQRLYTMLTRGSLANHLYLQVVGDGDPHSVIHPTLVHPRTPTGILEQVLARDEAQRSATSLLRDQSDPAVQLGHAAQRYLDSLHVAAEDVLRRHTTNHRDGKLPDNAIGNVVDVLDASADELVPGLSQEPAWPTLRAHLLLLGAEGDDATALLAEAVAAGDLRSAGDRAAVLDWRIDATMTGRDRSATSTAYRPGPLPWMPDIPTLLADDPQWGSYLSQRALLVQTLAAEVRTQAAEHTGHGRTPVWAPTSLSLAVGVIADVEVWRAAMQVADDDRRPTGPRQRGKAAATYQQSIARGVTGTSTPALEEWRHLLVDLTPQIVDDQFMPVLAERLAAMSRAGLPAHRLLRSAAATGGVLPDEHAAAALWWRMARHVTPAVAEQIQENVDSARVDAADGAWLTHLPELLGPERSAHIQASTWWPALVANIDHALGRGWQLEELLHARRPYDPKSRHQVDECQELVWLTSITLDPIPLLGDGEDQFDPPPDDLWDGFAVDPSSFVESPDDPANHEASPPSDPDLPDVKSAVVSDASNPDPERAFVEPNLAVAGLMRDLGPISLEPTDAELRIADQRAERWLRSPLTRERMLEINELACDYYETQYGTSWSRQHLIDRLGVDLARHEDFHPGHAPAGWTHLVDHLRERGVGDEEMLAVGVATTSSRGHLIDRFRDRLILPITHHDEVLGFVARRHPDLNDATRSGPKYLNTADTPLFHKGAQLYGLTDDLLDSNACPVVVEGPVDAIAVTLASAGRYVGLAPLGTALTDDQARQLATITQTTGRHPIVATDADLAGQVAAERDYWMLAPHGLDPAYARLPKDLDPAALLTEQGPAALTAALANAEPLGDHLLYERLTNLDPQQARNAALRVVAARPRHAWDPGAETVQTRLGSTDSDVRHDLLNAIQAWDTDPLGIARRELQSIHDVQLRLEAEGEKTPAERWAPLASRIDPRLATQPDWPSTAAALQQIHDHGHDVATTVTDAMGRTPLGELPARDLRYRLTAINADHTFSDPTSPPEAIHKSGHAHDRRTPAPHSTEPAQPPRR